MIDVLLWGLLIFFLIFLAITLLYVAPFFQRTINVKRTKQLLEENIEVVETVAFLERCPVLKQQLDKAIAEMQECYKRKAVLINEIEDLEKDKSKKGK